MPKKTNQAQLIFDQMQTDQSLKNNDNNAELVNQATEVVIKENGVIIQKESTEPVKEAERQEINFEKALEILGIKLSQDENKTAILDYSQCVKNFDSILEKDKVKRKIVKESLLDKDDDKTAISAIDDIEKNWNEMREYFKALISFFTNPPSKEIFELTNHNALINSVYQSLKKFEKDFNDLNLSANMSSKIRGLNDRIAELDNFNQQIEDKIEQGLKFYSNFAEEISKKQEEKLNSYIENTEEITQKMQDLFNSYDKAMSERLKFYKGGSKWLSIISLLLALGCGGLVFFVFMLTSEINKQGVVLNQLGNIGVEQTDKEVKLELPKEAKYIKKDDKTFIILSK